MMNHICGNDSTTKGIESANYKLLSLPLYLVEALPKILNEIRTGSF